MSPLTRLDLGDNCIQNLNVERYITGYTVKNIVLQWPMSRAVKCDFQTYIFNDIPPQMKILNMDIPILMHFCSFISILSVTCRIVPHVIQQNVT